MLNEVDETFPKQLQHVAKVFDPPFLAIFLRIHHYGGGLRPAPQQWGAAFSGPQLLWIP